MKKKVIITVIAVLLAIAAVIAAMAVTNANKQEKKDALGKTLSSEEKQRVYDRFYSYIDGRGFCGTVYAVYHGETVFDGGATREDDDQENGSEVAYGVASLTKEFTAAAIMQLYEKDKLNLDDTLDKYFPDYRFGDRITIHHLLCQRSGIPDYMVNTDNNTGAVIVSCYNGGSSHIVIDSKSSVEENAEKIRSFFLSRELLFEPGSQFDYSDSNYALLAQIIAQVSGNSYHDYIRKHIFKPLKMKHSAFIDDYDSKQITQIGSVDHEDFSGDYFDYAGAEYGCGDILTTPRDLYLWYMGLTSGKVVTQASYEQMTDNYSSEGEQAYGYGLMTSDKSDSKVVYHYGYIPSYFSTIIFIPEYDYFQVVVGNHSTGKPHHMAADMVKYFGKVIDLNIVEIE